MTRGWQAVNGRWYYMNGDGVMLTGWQYLSGRWYYLDGSGAMLFRLAPALSLIHI